VTRITATSSLWMASAAILAAALVLSGILAWRTFSGGSETLPEIMPLKVATLDHPAAATEPGKRNPFDPSGTHWQETRADLAPVAERGALNGLVVLPGVRLAITDGGVVKPGEALAGGKFRGFRGDKVSIETATGRLEKIDGPGANRPRLNDINQAGKNRPRAIAEGKS
jgi:hypothetical protein